MMMMILLLMIMIIVVIMIIIMIMWIERHCGEIVAVWLRCHSFLSAYFFFSLFFSFLRSLAKIFSVRSPLLSRADPGVGPGLCIPLPDPPICEGDFRV